MLCVVVCVCVWFRLYSTTLLCSALFCSLVNSNFPALEKEAAAPHAITQRGDTGEEKKQDEMIEETTLYLLCLFSCFVAFSFARLICLLRVG